MSKDQQLTVTPNPLEMHADTVAFEMSATLPVKMLKKGKVYTIRPFYVYGNNEIALDPIQFRAEDYPDAGATQPRASEDFSFAYNPAMSDGMLYVQGVASDPKSGKSKETERMAVAPGVITTPNLVETVYYGAIAPHGYNTEEELVPTRVNFYFDQGSSRLKYSEKRSERANKLEAFIAGKNVTRTVTITGTHSPEGPERINANLADERAQAIEDYYRAQMDKYDYEGMSDSITFITKDIVESWDIFKDSLAEYEGISQAEKQNWLEIINGPGTYEEKEDRLHDLPTYNKVFRELYPKLRVAHTEVLTVKEKKSEAEIAVLSKQVAEGQVSADTLSEEEMLYGGTLTPSLQEKENIYKAATKKTGSWVAHNNLAAVYIRMAAENEAQRSQYADQAMTQLEIAMNKNEAAAVHANMASVELLKDNPYKAYDHIRQAMNMSPDNETATGLNGVKAAVAIKIAEYDEAVRAASSAEETAENLFNLGLAQVLDKDYQNAINSFEQAAEKDADYAKAYYGAAIANAHLQNDDRVYENIEQAISLDPALKEKIMNDLVFDTYQDNQRFQDLLK
ncbi:MAG: TPR end-of-group domain-containing protein [Candidatus Cyclobacteriaceae bacterium M2_1C_046]